MKPHFFISSFLLLIFFSTPISAFPHFFTNISQNLPNLTLPTPWESFKNLSGCQNGDKLDGLAKVKQYFKQFGYLNNSNTNFTDDFDDSLESALKTYQKNFNLNTTGVLDNSTLDHIVLPRCGVADIVNGTSSMNSGAGTNTSQGKSSSIHSVAHYSFFPNQPRWPTWKRDLTYAFAPENQLSDTVKTVFSRAFAKWAAVTPLTFQESDSYSSADITIGFFNGNHGDGEPFDGILGTLAHAFSPPDGRFHLDDEENWVVEGDVSSSSLSGAIDLESVAVHEIGHLLGLGHSSVEEAIMYPTISTGVKKIELAQDDRDGVQVLYGSNPNYDGTDTSTTSQEGDRSDGGIFLRVGNFQWGMVVGMVGVLLLV